MSLDSLTDEEAAAVTAALSTLRAVEDHFRLRDRANAKLYLATVKWSPITKLVSKTATALSRLFDEAEQEVSPVPEEGEHPEEGAAELS